MKILNLFEITLVSSASPARPAKAFAICALAAAVVLAASFAVGKGHEDTPNAENAMAAEQEIATAIRNNDGDGIERNLADDWAVIATTGAMGEGKSLFADGINSGYLTRKSFDLSDPRVRLYGNVAVITTKVKTSGVLGGKPFDVAERQTDVLLWKDGKWKSVLTHETKIPG